MLQTGVGLVNTSSLFKKKFDNYVQQVDAPSARSVQIKAPNYFESLKAEAEKGAVTAIDLARKSGRPELIPQIVAGLDDAMLKIGDIQYKADTEAMNKTTSTNVQANNMILIDQDTGAALYGLEQNKARLQGLVDQADKVAADKVEAEDKKRADLESQAEALRIMEEVSPEGYDRESLEKDKWFQKAAPDFFKEEEYKQSRASKELDAEESRKMMEQEFSDEEEYVDDIPFDTQKIAREASPWTDPLYKPSPEGLNPFYEAGKDIFVTGLEDTPEGTIEVDTPDDQNIDPMTPDTIPTIPVISDSSGVVTDSTAVDSTTVEVADEQEPVIVDDNATQQSADEQALLKINQDYFSTLFGNKVDDLKELKNYVKPSALKKGRNFADEPLKSSELIAYANKGNLYQSKLGRSWQKRLMMEYQGDPAAQALIEDEWLRVSDYMDKDTWARGVGINVPDAEDTSYDTSYDPERIYSYDQIANEFSENIKSHQLHLDAQMERFGITESFEGDELQKIRAVMFNINFQLGPSWHKVRIGNSQRWKTNIFEAIEEGEYQTAIAKIRKSGWMTETPDRANKLIDVVNMIAAKKKTKTEENKT
jgi:hypothetical protein